MWHVHAQNVTKYSNTQKYTGVVQRVENEEWSTQLHPLGLPTFFITYSVVKWREKAGAFIKSILGVPDRKDALHAQVLHLYCSEISSSKRSRSPVAHESPKLIRTHLHRHSYHLQDWNGTGLFPVPYHIWNGTDSYQTLLILYCTSSSHKPTIHEYVHMYNDIQNII